MNTITSITNHNTHLHLPCILQGPQRQRPGQCPWPRPLRTRKRPGILRGWRNTTVANHRNCLAQTKYHGPPFTDMCVKNRGVRFHRIRDFKQYYFNSIRPTSQTLVLKLNIKLCTLYVALHVIALCMLWSHMRNMLTSIVDRAMHTKLSTCATRNLKGVVRIRDMI